MVKTLLLSVDLDAGSEVLALLDRAKLKISVALWAYLSEYEDWRLILAARSFDLVKPKEGYGLLHKALDAQGFPSEKTPTVMIVRMDDPFIKELRRHFAKARSVEGMRLGGQSFGNRWVEDAYVYRIS